MAEENSGVPMDIPQPNAAEFIETADSRAEELAFAAGVNPGSEKAARNAARIQRLTNADTHLHRVIIWGLYLVAISAALMFIAIVLDLLWPSQIWSPDKIVQIKQLLFSGAVGAVTTRLSRDYFKGDSEAN